MSNEEFENYVALMGKLLQFSPEQRDQISGELQDHLQMRVADLVSEGVARPEAISQALEEFGDAAVMAKNFQTVINLKRRRWIMRFATFSIAGVFLAAVLTMAMWPDNSRFGAPDKSMAQADEADFEQSPDDEPEMYVSDATRRTLLAEAMLKKAVDLDFDERPFKEIEKELENTTGLNILLSSSATDDSLGEDEPITFDLKGVPLNKALHLMLRTKNATYVIDEGVVVIISLDDAEDAKWHRLKIFDCRELVKQLPETNRPAPSRDQSLLDLVQEMIQPDSWSDTGQGLGQIQVVNGILVVAQTEEILQEIENFVADLEGNLLQKGKRGIKVRTSSNQLPKPIMGSPFGSAESHDDPFGAQTQKGKAEKDPFADN